MESAKFTRIPSMRERMEDTLSAHRNELVSLLSRYVAQGKGILQPHHLLDELDNIIADDQGRMSLRDGPFGEVLKCTQLVEISKHDVEEFNMTWMNNPL